MCVVTRTPSEHVATQGASKGDRVVHFEEQGSYLRCPGGDEQHLTWAEVLDGQKDGLQVWKKGRSRRDPYVLLNKKRSETTHFHLLHALSCEMFGDVIQTLKLMLAHKRVTYRHLSLKNTELNGKIMQIEQTCDIKLHGTAFFSVIGKIDGACRKAIENCYTDFQSLVEPILKEETVLELMEYYKTHLPAHYNMMNIMLGYDEKRKLLVNAHLLDQNFYDKKVFYHFLSLSRTKNCHNCTHWALISRGADYGRGITQYSHSSSIYFGDSVAYNTFIVATDKYRVKMIEQIKKVLSRENIFVATMDNNERGYPIKFPRSGSNNKFVKVTGRTFVEAAKTKYNLSEEYKTKVTYTDQKIISAYKMPHFENLINDGTIDYGQMVLTLENPASVTNDRKEVDVTGL